MLIQGSVGQPTSTSIASGTTPTVRLGQLGDVVVSELHGRFYEQVYRNNMFSVGTLAATAFTANHISGTSTGTPILGVANPSTSTVNLVLSQAALQVFPNSLTSGAAPSGFVWAWSLGNAGITTAGVVPYNRKTLAQAGSQARGFGGSSALTGLTNTIVAAEGADFQTPGAVTYTTLGSTSIQPSVGGVQNFDGSLIVPPGAVLGLLAIAAATTFSFVGRLMWEEVPV
jgi:hypothetical protein